MESWVCTYTKAATVLSKYVTITSLIHSGQSDASGTFQDMLSRSLTAEEQQGG